MDKKTIIIAVVAVLAILGAAACSKESSRANLKPFEQVGAAGAEEVAKVLNNQGTVIVVTEAIEGVANPNNEAQLKGFKAGLAKAKGVTLKEVKELKRDMSGDPREWPAGRVGEIANLASSAVVLFINLPQTFPARDVAVLKGAKGKLVVIGTQSPQLDAAVNSGVVQAAIVARTPPPPAPSGAESPAQWFARVYTVLRAP
ncbi:MAG: hypothetical protein ACKODH_09515 [Limisphaerales bacterium]